jgi:2-iminoacetate synthase
MSFVEHFNQLELAELSAFAQRATAEDVRRALERAKSASGTLTARYALRDFAALISPAAEKAENGAMGEWEKTKSGALAHSPVRPFTHSLLEEMAQQAHELTVKHFGRVMRFFAPLYLSNECVNICRYCGFSRNNAILRVTLTPEQVRQEARYLAAEGFRNVLLVAGEHPRFVSKDYVAECVKAARAEGISAVSVEVAPMETADYVSWVSAGAEGLVVYQESYNREVYAEMHTSGPKRDFDWRLESVERGYAAGFRRLGIGALLGLWNWRQEAIALAAHAEYLLRHCWKAQLTISLPRLRPAAGEFEPKYQVSERQLAQLVCALRLTFPKVGLVLSTRERAEVRDGLARLGITLMSAGAHTEPGGYTGAGKESLHLTEKGRQIGRFEIGDLRLQKAEHATVQFEISDTRSAAVVAGRLRELGFEIVWKDWDEGLGGGW